MTPEEANEAAVKLVDKAGKGVSLEQYVENLEAISVVVEASLDAAREDLE